MAIEIREPTEIEVAPIKRLYGVVTDELRRIYRPCSDTPDSTTRKTIQLGIFDGNLVLGAVQYHVLSDSLLLQGLAIDPQQRRRGLARALVSSLEQQAKTLGKTFLELETVEETGNTTVFLALGFKNSERYPATRVEGVNGGLVHIVRMQRQVKAKCCG